VANPENLQGHGFHLNPENINLAGKPKGARNRRTIYREHLEKMGKNGQVVDDIVLAAIARALKGDMNAVKELMDSGYGKVPDKALIAETEPEKIEDADVTQKLLSQFTTEQLEKILQESKNV